MSPVEELAQERADELPPPRPRCPHCGAVDFDVIGRDSKRMNHVVLSCGDCGAVLGFLPGSIPGP